jgi:hypothetical protein
MGISFFISEIVTIKNSNLLKTMLGMPRRANNFGKYLSRFSLFGT